MMKAVLLYNPAAGRGRLSERRQKQIHERLLHNGIQCRSVSVGTEGSPIRLLADLRDCGLLLVHGGDGTLHHVLPAVVENRLPVALLPGGTANVLAHELGIPRDLERALRVAISGERRRMRLGISNGTYFHLMTGVGLDGFVLSRMSPRLKRTLGLTAYWLAGLISVLRYHFPTFDVCVGDQTRAATFALISNVSRYGGQLRITPRASPFEDTLDICVFSGRKRLDFVRYLLGILLGIHLRFPDVVYEKSRRVDVVGEKDIRVQLDGELEGRLPLKLSIGDPVLEIVTPHMNQRPSLRGSKI